MRTKSAMQRDAAARFEVMGSQMAQEEFAATRRRTVVNAVAAPVAAAGAVALGYLSYRMQATPSWYSDAAMAISASAVATFSTVGAFAAHRESKAEASALRDVMRREARQRESDPYGMVQHLNRVNPRPEHWPELRE